MSLLGDSLKKTKIMNETSQIVSLSKMGDRNLAYKNFYDFISSFSALSQIIQGNLTFEEFSEISKRLSALGLAWEKGYYVPIAVFSFAQPLAFVVGNKDIFLNPSANSENFLQMAYMAQAILLR